MAYVELVDRPAAAETQLLSDKEKAGLVWPFFNRF